MLRFIVALTFGAMTLLFSPACIVHERTPSVAQWTSFHNSRSNRLSIPMPAVLTDSAHQVHSQSYRAVKILRIVVDGREVTPQEFGLIVEDEDRWIDARAAVYLVESSPTMSTP